jgi:hypothetical protein
MKNDASRLTFFALALPGCFLFVPSCKQAVYRAGDLEVTFIPNISRENHRHGVKQYVSWRRWSIREITWWNLSKKNSGPLSA